MTTSQQALDKRPDYGEIKGYIDMPETGDYANDCATGRRFADALINRMNLHQSPLMLQQIKRGIVQEGRWTPTHIGFFQRIAERCITAA